MPTWPASGRASTSSRAPSLPPTRDCSRPRSTPSVAAEAYNGAMWRLSEAKKAVRKAEAQEQQAKKAVKDQRVRDRHLRHRELPERHRAEQRHRGDGRRGSQGPDEPLRRRGECRRLDGGGLRRVPQGARLVAKAYTKKAAKAQKRQESLAVEARELRDAAEAAANAAAVAAGQIATQKEQLVQALAEAQNISVELAGKRQQALEQIAQEKAAAAAQAEGARGGQGGSSCDRTARESARDARSARRDHTQAQNDSKSTGSSTGGGYVDPGPPVNGSPPAPGNGAQRAVAYAKAQLGKPYLWAAAGPNAFDCSGLTMMAWAPGGKSLPHWSVAQFQQSTRIGVGSLRPGDLVFWGSQPRLDPPRGDVHRQRADHPRPAHRASRCRSTACTTGCRRTTSRVPDAAVGSRVPCTPELFTLR